jgi:hypothetical protein
MLGVLGLRVLLIEDDVATARTLALRTPVDRANQRFGNVCRISAKLLEALRSRRRRHCLRSFPQNDQPGESNTADIRTARAHRRRNPQEKSRRHVLELPLVYFKEEPMMIDALFWCTGLVVWILIVFGAVSTFVVNIHDRSVLKRGEHFSRR